MLARHTWKAAGLVAGSAAYVWNRLATRTPANSEEEHAQYQMKVGEQRLWDDYVEPDTLACWIRTDTQEPSFTFAVVDVRDTDLRRKRTDTHRPKQAKLTAECCCDAICTMDVILSLRLLALTLRREGNLMIKGAVNVPASAVRADPASLLKRLEHADVVVFHCMHSQQRGPGSAQTYARVRDRMRLKVSATEVRDCDANSRGQKVLVLRGGFKGFYKAFGEKSDCVDLFQPAATGAPK